jgi:hypothetical protein
MPVSPAHLVAGGGTTEGVEGGSMTGGAKAALRAASNMPELSLRQ